MNKIILLSGFILFCSITTYAQYSVHGEVFDEQTNTPLPGASVFIANTTKGTSTGVDGKFDISGLQDIHYNLVVSFLGYEPVVFDIVPGGSISYQVKLKPSVQVLSEVVVKAEGVSKTHRHSDLRDFKDHFIGLSWNANQCRFENEDAMLFIKENNVLLAFCDTALVMRNNGLGYRLKVILQRYEFDSKKQSVLFEGQMAYESLNAKNEKEKKRWAKNRLRAYYGSEMHFFRALYNHRLNEEGFYFSFYNTQDQDSLMTVQSPALYNYQIQVRTIMDYDKIIIYHKSAVAKEDVLRFTLPLTVVYINEIEDFSYQRSRRMPVRHVVQTSKLTSWEPARVLPDGRVYPIEAAEASGYWSWELMSEALPLDYDPVEDLKILGRKN